MSNAKDAMTKADNLLSNPNFINDARNTMAQLRSASTQVSEMAQRINKLLSKKHPILHMILGASLSHAANAKVEESTQEEIKPGKAVSKSSAHFEYTENHPGYVLHQSTTENNVSETESNSNADDSLTPSPAPVHGEIK